MTDNSQIVTVIMAIVGIITGLGSFILSIYLFFDKRENTKQSKLLTNGQYVLAANEGALIANQRATDAERARRDLEVTHAAEIATLKDELKKVTERVEIVEKALSYEIRLVAHLGDDPHVEAISIKRLPILESTDA